MTSPTQQLLDLLQQDTNAADFKQKAMDLVRQGADAKTHFIGDFERAHTLLHHLVLNNKQGVNNEEIKELVALDKQIINCTNYSGATALQCLMYAYEKQQCSFDTFKQTAMLLASLGADIRNTHRSGYFNSHPLLHLLVLNNKDGVNNAEIIKLVELDVIILNSTNHNVKTALQSLIRAYVKKKCDFDTFKQTAMLLAGLGVNIKVSHTEFMGDSYTLLSLLALSNKDGANDEAIKTLVDLDETIINCHNLKNETVLQSLIRAYVKKKCSFDTFKQTAMLLAELGADITVCAGFYEKRSLLHLLITNNQDGVNDKEINTLIEMNRAILNVRDEWGLTPVQDLLIQNPKASVEAIKKLLPENDINDEHQFRNFLHRVCASGNLKATSYFVDLYIKNGWALGKKSNSVGETFLHSAVHSGNEKLVDYLTGLKEIDINAQNHLGNTALHIAILLNKPKLVELLINNGASLLVRNNEKEMPYDIAMMRRGFKADPEKLKDTKVELMLKIRAMHDYGKLLESQGVAKGQMAVELAQVLTALTEDFFEKEPNEADFQAFQEQFKDNLHSKDKEMSTYRTSWSTILLNIGIALTGIGAVLMAGKLIYSQATEKRPLFFFQNSKTSSEEKIADVEQAVGEIQYKSESNLA